MTALDTERLTPQMVGSSGPMVAKHYQPVAADVKIFAGSLVAIDAGYAKPGAAGTSLWCIGKALATVDNTDGDAGDLDVEVLAGCFRFENSASSDEIAQDDVGSLCYVVDDQTVALTSNSNARSVAGLIIAVDSVGVWVLMGVHNMNSFRVASTAVAEFVKAAADGAAATATAETAFARIPFAGTIVAAYYTPSAGLTAHDTDYATLLLDKRDGAGGAAANVATLTTQIASGSWTAFVPKSLGAISNGTLAAGNVLTIEITKTGNGVAVPSGQLSVVYSVA